MEHTFHYLLQTKYGGSLYPSENILYTTNEVHHSLSLKRISLAEYEGCNITLSVLVHWHWSFWTRQCHACKLESSTKYFFFLTNVLFKLSGNHEVSDICELNWKSSIDSFAMSDLSIFASIGKFLSKLISTLGSTVWF